MIEKRTTVPQDLEHPDLGEHDEELPKRLAQNDSVKHLPPYSVTGSNARNVDRRSSSFFDEVHRWPKEIRNMIAGGLAGIVAKTVVAPVDRIKILYQISSAEFRLTKIPFVVQNIVREEGISALWKGNSVTLLRVFPYSGIQFMVFDRIKLFFLKKHDNDQDSKNARKFGLTPTESLAAGMIAGAISVICTYPLDLARAQLAVLKKHKHGSNKGFVGLLKDNYSTGGASGWFRGLTPTLVGILPYSGIAFALNEQGKREIQNVAGRDLTTTERIQCGAFAGLIAQSVAYPIEVTRRRMQTVGLLGKSGDTALSVVESKQFTKGRRPPTFTEIVLDLYAEQGIRGFYKGLSMNWIKGPVAFSISFTMFDVVQNIMETPSERAIRVPRRMLTRLRNREST